jgi:hypothetical protein
MEQLWFLRGPYRDVISKGQSQDRELCTGVCEERTWARESEEYPLLEAVARERLVKTQQDRKSLAGAVVICELSRLAMVNNSSHQSKPRLHSQILREVFRVEE